jgi:hypothetical protein
MEVLSHKSIRELDGAIGTRGVDARLPLHSESLMLVLVSWETGAPVECPARKRAGGAPASL